MPDSSEQGRRWTLHRISNQTGRNPESGGWTLRPRYDQHSRIEESIQVMPVAEHEVVAQELRAEVERLHAELGAIQALLPQVYDGLHLVDCPYVEVLMRIRSALDRVSASQAANEEGNDE